MSPAPVQATVPELLTVRALRNFSALPLMASVPPAGIVVIPLAIVPPVQFSVPVTEISPAPPSVPEEKVSVGTVIGLVVLSVNVPPLMVMEVMPQEDGPHQPLEELKFSAPLLT